MWLYRVNQVLRPAIKPYWRLGLAGAIDRIPPDGPLVLVSNHSCYLDPWLIGMAFPRVVRFLIDQGWYEASRFYTGLFHAFGAVPTSSKDPEATVEAVCRVLARGEVVAMFPEGSISHDGRIRRFRSGVCYIAARSGVPVLPLGVRGAFESLPRHRRFPKPVKVTVHVGEPVWLEGAPFEGPIPEEASRQFMDRIFQDVCRLSGRQTGASRSQGVEGRVRGEDRPQGA